MQCKSDAIKMRERAWGRNPGTMPTYLFSRPCRANPSGSGRVVLGTGSEAGGQRWRARKEEGKTAPPPKEDREQSRSPVSEASLAPPRIKTSVRGLVKQQQDNATGKPTLNFAMKQDKMHLNGPIFHSSPIHVCNYSQGYPVCALGCPAGCLDPGLASSCISSLHCMQCAPCSRSADDYLAHKHKLP